ncbi:MAG TPA: hypothetical protein VH853_17565 [Polyangia bacterium]|nr:hypothetical protein [Polyangia bacterium]
MIGLAASGPAMGWTLGDPESPSTIDVHGFVSQGYIKSTANDYLVDSSGGGSFEFSEAGLNFTVQPLDRLSIGMQLFAYNLGTSGNFTLRADWFYLDYRFRDWLGIRAGRVKLVYGLYNDISDIDAARTPILLPPSIYPLSNRDLLFGVQGGEVYGYARLGSLGGLEYRAVGGAIDIPLPSQIGQAVEASSVDIPYLVAGRLMWETPLDGLRVGGSVLALRLNEDVFFPGVPADAATESARATLYGAIGSIEYVAHDLQLAAEYAQTRNEARELAPTPTRAPTVVGSGGYALATYRVSRWFQPGAYYSFSYANRNLGSQSAPPAPQNDENVQDDLAGTLRFDVNNFWIVKLEGHYMHGTEALGGVPTAATNWGLFLIKTTGYF